MVKKREKKIRKGKEKKKSLQRYFGFYARNKTKALDVDFVTISVSLSLSLSYSWTRKEKRRHDEKKHGGKQ